MSTKQDTKNPRVTTPSDSRSGKNKEVASIPGTTTTTKPRARPGIIASVGKYFSRKKRTSKSPPPRLSTPDDLLGSVNVPFELTPVEKRYLKVVETQADKDVRTVLASCHIDQDQTDIIIKKG